jgi:hypothetical protein
MLQTAPVAHILYIWLDRTTNNGHKGKNRLSDSQALERTVALSLLHSFVQSLDK